jgi:integrase
MDPDGQVIREFKATLRRAGLRNIRFHDLRHTYANLLIDQGEHPKYIQTQMGHPSINITIDTYGHLMSIVNREASSRLDQALFASPQAKGKTSVPHI